MIYTNTYAIHFLGKFALLPLSITGLLVMVVVSL